MFSSVELEGFRGVKRCEKPLKLSKFTLLIGANNSGKSAVLEALALIWVQNRILRILGNRLLDIILWIHGSWSSLVYRYSGYCYVRYVLDLRGKGSFNFTLKVNDIGGFDLRADQAKDKEGEDYVSRALFGVPISEAIDELSKYIAFIPRNDTFQDQLGRGLFNNWDLVEKTGAHSKVVKNVIAKVVEDRLTEAALKKNDIVLRKEYSDGDSAYIRLQDKGDGIKRFLPVALYLEALNPKVVLWDDLETSAHPSMINAIISWLAEHEWQVIASTHSIDVLREFVTLGPREGKVLTLKKSADDILTYKELSIDELEKLLDSGQDVRKLMEWR